MDTSDSAAQEFDTQPQPATPEQFQPIHVTQIDSGETIVQGAPQTIVHDPAVEESEWAVNAAAPLPTRFSSNMAESFRYSFKVHRLLWIVTLISLGVNLLMFTLGFAYVLLIRSESQKISAELAKLNTEEVTLPITIAQDLPVKMEFPYKDNIQVPVDVNIPVNLTVKVDEIIQVPISQEIEVNSDVLVQVPVLGPQRVPFSTTIPVEMIVDVPVKLDIPVSENIPVKFNVEAPIDTTIKIDTTMPINMQFPVIIPVDELGTGPLIEQLNRSLSRIFFFRQYLP
ncbi:MAG TPA: hypothetical protein PK299_09805 [Anaerolineales bacterium]|nr:hypothetical protein [Anaerolineales bacterium]